MINERRDKMVTTRKDVLILNLFQKMTEKDPSVYLTPDQPLVCSTKVSQSDVDKQEARVLETRKKLAEALAALTA